MDAASVLEQQTQSMSNLPDELKFLLKQLREKDMDLYTIRKGIQQKDGLLQKYIKINGSLAKYPDEEKIFDSINEQYRKAMKVQRQKCVIANTALYLLTRHLKSLEQDAAKLEASGEPKILGMLDDIGSSDPEAVELLTEGMLQASLGQTSPSPQISSRRYGSRRGRSRHSRSRSRSRSRSIERRSSSVSSTASLSSRRRARMENLPSQASNTENKAVGETTRASGRKKMERNNSGTVTIPQANRKHGEDTQLYCFCRQVSYGNMIACDNKDCKYEWFHWSCVGLSAPPKGIWYCPDCRKRMDAEKKG